MKFISAAAALTVALNASASAQQPLIAPGSAVDATAPSPLAIGETFTIQSKTLSETRRINVYMPPQYTESRDTRLPVLYMPDGGIAEDFLHVAGLVQVSTGNGTMRPFILVGIENTQRRRDLTGPTQNAEDRKIAPKVGGSAAFRRFIRSELMPVINSRYRTTAESAIIGESLAGLFIVETLFLEPDLFDTYIAFDPSVWWNDGELVNHAAERLRNGKFGDRRLHMASSADDRAGAIGRFAEILRKNAPRNLKWEFKAMPNETHATIYHPAALHALRRLFKPPER
jgi:predicted alpha/beta superfamily hydrolase